ncbi:MAG: DUF1244 domain-containing protein [Pseudomonadota bacterium]
MTDVPKIDPAVQTELEAASFRRLVDHLRERNDVQNIDMMNLTGFCRNCLSRWYDEAAADRGVEIGKMPAREIIYGMPFEEWRGKYQTEASGAQQEQFKDAIARHGESG